MTRDKAPLTRFILPGFAPVHRAVKRQTISEAWLCGGRGSGKSSFIALELVLGLIADRDANAMVYRRVARTLRESVYSQILWAIEALGWRPWFDARLSPMELVYRPTGQRIMFQGADDPAKSKSIKLSKGYFKYLWFEELTEFGGMEDIRTIKASILRGGGWACTFYSYNPPKSARNWTNAEALVPRPGRLVNRSDYTSVPPKWLGPAFLAEAEALRLTNERAYRQVYLGEITGTGGQVFDNLNIREITQAEMSTLGNFYSGLDFGFAVDPDAYVRGSYDARRRVLTLTDEYYATRTPLDELAQAVRGRCGADLIRADSAEPRSIDALRRAGLNIAGAKKGPDSVAHGMRWLQELGGIVIDPARCPHAAREFSGYEYEQDRSGAFRASYPDRDNHTIDAVRYMTEGLRAGRLGFASPYRPGKDGTC